MSVLSTWANEKAGKKRRSNIFFTGNSFDYQQWSRNEFQIQVYDFFKRLSCTNLLYKCPHYWDSYVE